ncbi:MAG TPA: hypothetical protein VK525_00235 [Candidatus Saccharimonadales bacterium]|nr:hypothetical protein [Candidatus Saccharimonadales bacterium]
MIHFDWHTDYLAAICETDDRILKEKILRAETSMRMSLQAMEQQKDLAGCAKITTALEALKTLQGERLPERLVPRFDNRETL